MDEQETRDATCIEAVKADIKRGLEAIREAQGYGKIVVTIEVKGGTIVQQEVGTTISRKL